MGFKSIDEIETFSFEDCEIVKFEIAEDQIRMELEALIVEPQNSQNTNFTESYAGTTTVRLQGGKLLSGTKEGFKRYDANETLLEEVPDVKLSLGEVLALTKTFEGTNLFEMAKESEADGVKTYKLRVEFPGENVYDNAENDTYELMVSFEQAIFEWERYMSRVQR